MDKKKIFNIVFRVIILIAGVVVTADAVLLTFVSNHTLGVWLTYALGIILLLIGAFYRFVSQKIPKVIILIFVSILILVTAFVSFLYIYGSTDNVTYREDAVVVLGAGIHGERISVTLKDRLDCAVEYHKKNPEAVIVVSGGQGYQESITEALAMERYLLSQGVDAEKIIKEEKSTSTTENFKFSKAILDKRLGDGYKTVYITNDFHILRAGFVAERQGLSNVSHIHSDTLYYTVLPNGMREVLAVMKYWVFG